MKLLIIILCFCLMAAPVQAQEQKAAPVAAGVVVVVVGGVVVVVLIRTCKKLFPKTTNAPPELMFSGGSQAASSLWFDGYCHENDLKSLPAPEQLVDGLIEYDGYLSQFSLRKEKDTCSLIEFRQAMAGYGLGLEYGEHYAINGKPCEPWESSIFVEHGDVPAVTVYCSGRSVTTVVEKSYDLFNWVPVITNTVPSCYKVRFTDRTESDQAFYRTTTLP